MRQLLAPLLCAAAARAMDSTPWGNYDGNGGLADVSALPAWRSSLRCLSPGVARSGIASLLRQAAAPGGEGAHVREPAVAVIVSPRRGVQRARRRGAEQRRDQLPHPLPHPLIAAAVCCLIDRSDASTEERRALRREPEPGRSLGGPGALRRRRSLSG